MMVTCLEERVAKVHVNSNIEGNQNILILTIYNMDFKLLITSLQWQREPIKRKLCLTYASLALFSSIHTGRGYKKVKLNICNSSIVAIYTPPVEDKVLVS